MHKSYQYNHQLHIRQTVIDLSNQVRELGGAIHDASQLRDKVNGNSAQLQQASVKLGALEQSIASLSVSVSQLAAVAHTHSE